MDVEDFEELSNFFDGIDKFSEVLFFLFFKGESSNVYFKRLNDKLLVDWGSDNLLNVIEKVS